jgi:hypothetical protein
LTTRSKLHLSQIDLALIIAFAFFKIKHFLGSSRFQKVCHHTTVILQNVFGNALFFNRFFFIRTAALKVDRIRDLVLRLEEIGLLIVLLQKLLLLQLTDL